MHDGFQLKQFLTIALDDCMGLNFSRLKLHKQSPDCVLLGFTVAVAMVSIFTIANAFHRVDLEGFSYPTALGDQSWFKLDLLPQPHDMGDPLFTYEGRQLYQRKRKPLRHSDMLMLKVGIEDSGRYHLYRYSGEREGSPDSGIYFIKTGRDQYIRVGNARLGSRE